MSDMFHFKWERRHGSLTALRHIVRLHGTAAGKSSAVPTHLVRGSQSDFVRSVKGQLNDVELFPKL